MDKTYFEKRFDELAFNKELVSITPHLWETFTEMRTRRVFVDENLVSRSSKRYSEQTSRNTFIGCWLVPVFFFKFYSD
jgi:hypothetical protein